MEEIEVEQQEPEGENEFMIDYVSVEIVNKDKDACRDLEPDDCDEYRFKMLGDASRVEHYIVKKLDFLRRFSMDENIWDATSELMQMQRAGQFGGHEVRQPALDNVMTRETHIMP
eukprot:s2889_g13.t1